MDYANNLCEVFKESLTDLEKAHNTYIRRINELRKQRAAARGYDKVPIYTPERKSELGYLPHP